MPICSCGKGGISSWSPSLDIIYSIVSKVFSGKNIFSILIILTIFWVYCFDKSYCWENCKILHILFYLGVKEKKLTKLN